MTTEARRGVVGWEFSQLGLAKVYASSDLRNAGSWRVMEKTGMTRARVLRSHATTRNGRADQVLYGILRQESGRRRRRER